MRILSVLVRGIPCLRQSWEQSTHTVSLSLVRGDVLSLIKELHVLFSHKNILWDNLVSVLMDSGNVMRATKVDTRNPLRDRTCHFSLTH